MIDYQNYHWCYFDYKDGWVGVRIEPEDRMRVNAIKSVIPERERIYLRDKRTWIFLAKWTPHVLEIVRRHCAGFKVILQIEHAPLLQSLLLGAAQLTLPDDTAQQTTATESAPRGVVFGTPERLGTSGK